jgi:hypothetical protein
MLLLIGGRAALGDKFGDGLGEGVGLAAATGSAGFDELAPFAEGLFFDSAPSLVPAKTGATEMAASSKLQSHRFGFMIYLVLLNREPFSEIDKHATFSP